MIGLALLLSAVLVFQALTTATPSPSPETGDVFGVPAVIDAIEADVSGDSPTSITLRLSGTWGTGCTNLPIELIQTTAGNAIFVELSERVGPAQTCPAMLRPLSETIVLTGEFEGGPFTIDVNGLTVEVAAIGAPTPDQDTIRVGDEPDWRPVSVSQISTLATASIPPQIRVTVTGTLPTGCTDLPLRVVQRLTESVVEVTIEQDVSPAEICPAMLVEYNAVVSILNPGGGLPAVTVNGVTQHSAQAPIPPALVVIDSASAAVTRSQPARIVVTVTGSLGSGCGDLPVFASQQQSGNLIEIFLAQYVPPETMCTAMIVPFQDVIPVEGSFEPGTYQIAINGFTLDPITVGP
jgi:hypothetical protein